MSPLEQQWEAFYTFMAGVRFSFDDSYLKSNKHSEAWNKHYKKWSKDRDWCAGYLAGGRAYAVAARLARAYAKLPKGPGGGSVRGRKSPLLIPKDATPERYVSRDITAYQWD